MEKTREEREVAEWEISGERRIDCTRGVYAEEWRAGDEFDRWKREDE